MYIRRKVFSVALDENGEERYFSTNEIINEEDYLDEVLYSEDEEGYLDEVQYSEEEEPKKKSHLGRNIALGTAGTAALAGGGIYGAKKIGANQEALWKAVQLAERDKSGMTSTELDALKKIKKDKELMKKVKNIRKGKPTVDEIGAKIRRGKNLQKPADSITNSKVGKWVAENAGKGNAWVKAHPYKAAGGAAAAIGLTGAGIYGVKKLKNRKSNKD